MTTAPAGYENVLLKRGLLALAAAFPAEFTASVREVVRWRLRNGYEVLETRIEHSDPCKMHGHLVRQLAANRAMLSAIRDPKRAAAIRAKVKCLEGDIQRIDAFLNPLRRRAADSERTCALEACERLRRESLGSLLSLFDTELFGNALAEYLAAQTDRAVCGENVDDFIANRAALLTDGY